MVIYDSLNEEIIMLYREFQGRCNKRFNELIFSRKSNEINLLLSVNVYVAVVFPIYCKCD